MVHIGIDLGTTYSCVAIVENGKPCAIHNSDGKFVSIAYWLIIINIGKYTVPSVVAFTDKEILVGNTALEYTSDLSRVLYGGLFHFKSWY